MHRFFPAIVGVVLVLAVSLALLPAPTAHAAVDRDAVLDLTFPVAGATSYSDTYLANRDGGARRHQATDIFAAKGQAVHAAVGGTICFAPGIEEPMPYYGYMLRVCNGPITYSYIHLNNDTPGTDDGRSGYRGAYAPGIREGVTVERGQLIGYVGDSGNAEDTPPHLHFDIFDRSFEDPAIASAPWRQHYRNPYPSLRAAQAKGEVARGALRLGSRGASVARWQELLNSVTDAGLTADGVFGPATDAATRAFQRVKGLADDGIVGAATMAVMEAASGTTATPVSSVVTDTASGTTGSGFPGRLLRLEDPMMRGDDVRAWQARMQERGWRGADRQPLDVDGIFGADSDRAARLFQEEKGLDVDGIVGASTWAAVFAT